jgi:hypothetical protein
MVYHRMLPVAIARICDLFNPHASRVFRRVRATLFLYWKFVAQFWELQEYSTLESARTDAAEWASTTYNSDVWNRPRIILSFSSHDPSPDEFVLNRTLLFSYKGGLPSHRVAG